MFITKQHGRASRVLALWVAVSHLGAFTAPAFANPGGGQVTAGAANISSSGSVTSIHQATDRAVINWQTFSNAAGETVNFQQPSSSSITLNRVSGASHSQIDGALNANGRVFLLNPNGVVFGKTAQVKVNGLVTSTLDMDDDAGFMNGRNSHSLSQNPARPQASVVNQGRIEAGSGGVAFVAPIVNNQGHIVAALGQVSLAGTTKAVVNYDQQGLVNVAIPAGKGGRGDVTVPQGADSELLMDAAAAPGVVEAGAITRTADGRIILKHAEGLALNEGTIVARGANGSGGVVRVHGTQGSILGKQSLIDVNATGRGHGGDVRVTSGGVAITTRGSRIVARGGDDEGDGGYVDISAPHFEIRGTADVRAPRGNAGTILLDPNDIEIVDAATGNSDGDVADNSILAGDTTANDPALISETTLEGLSGNIILEANNTIIVRDLTTDGALTLQSGASLTLRTLTGNISFDNAANQIVATGGGGITVTAGDSASLGILSAIGGTVAITAPNGIATAAITADTLNLTTDGTASQTGVYTVTGTTTLAGVTGGSGAFALDTQANVLGTVTTGNQVDTLAVRADAGFQLDAVSAATSVTLASDGVVTQSGAIQTSALILTSVAGGTGTFQLANQNNTVSTVETTNQVDTVAVRADGGFATNAITAASQVSLQSDGTVTQTAGIVTPTIIVQATTPGSGTFTLDSSGNDATTISTSNQVAAVTFRDDNGFDVNGMSATGAVTLGSDGTVTQSGVIAADTLIVTAPTAGSGVFTLDTSDNAVNTVQTGTQVTTLAFLDSTGFAVNGLDAATSVSLVSDGTVTQTGAITTPSLTLAAQNAGQGTFQLDGANNDTGLTVTGQVTSVAYRDDNGFDVSGIDATGAVTLQSDGAVTQSGIITADTLTVSGTNAGNGMFALDTMDNAVTTLQTGTQVATLAFQDNTGFAVAGLLASGSASLTSDGTVTQSGAIVTPALTVTAATAGQGTFQLDGANNDTALTVTGQVASLAYRDDNGFDVSGIDAATSVTLQSNGTVSQSGTITTPSLTLASTTNGQGTFNLQTMNNDVDALSGGQRFFELNFRDDDGFALGAMTVATDATLTSNLITQTGSVTALQLLLTASTAGAADFTLDTSNNNVQTLVTTNQVNTLAFRDDNGFSLSLTSGAVTSVTLQSDGTVNQGVAMSTPLLTLAATTPGSGTFNFGGTSNTVTTLATANTVGNVSFRDNGGIVVGLFAVTTAELISDTTITQTGTITASSLQLTATNAGNLDVDLTTQNNSFGTVTTGNTVNMLALRDDAGFAVGAVTADTSITLRSNGAVTQSGAITTPLLTLAATASGSGDFTLDTQNNALGTVTSTGTVSSVALRDDAGYVLGALTAATSIALTGGGGDVTQTGVVNAPALILTAQGAGGGSFRLNTQNNVLGTVTTTNRINALDVRDSAGLTFGATNVAALDVNTDGTLNQTAPMIATSLILRSSTDGMGDVVLDAANQLGLVDTANVLNTVLIGSTGTMQFLTLQADTRVTLTSSGLVQEVGAAGVTAPSLELSGTGTFVLDRANDVDTLAGNLTGGSLTYNDVNGVAIGAVASTGLHTRGGNLTVTAQSIAMNESVDLGAGTGVLVATAGITNAAGRSFTANALALNGGAGNAIGSAAARFNTNVNSLTVTDGTGNGNGASSLFLNEINDLTLTALVGGAFDVVSGGALTLTRISASSATALSSGNMVLGALTTGTFDLRAGGSVTDANGAATNITSTGAGRISVDGFSSTIGSVADPIEVAQGGTLTVNVPGAVSGVSAAFAGTLPGGRAGVLIEQAPGIVFFNGFPVNVSVFQLVTTALGQGAAGAILSSTAQLQDLVEVAADNADETQTDETEAQRKRAAKKPAKPAAKAPAKAAANASRPGQAQAARTPATRTVQTKTAKPAVAALAPIRTQTGKGD